MKLRWGLIGYGDLAEKRVASALQNASESELSAVWGRDPGKTRAFAERHGIEKACASLDELLNGKLDCVYVCTPPGSHPEYAIRAAEAGCHVLVEKPMAATGEECDQMIAAARKAGVRLGVAYYRRSFPKMLHIRKLIQEGALGQPVWINIAAHSWFAPAADDPKHWRVEPEHSGGAGALADIGVHRLDLLDYWLGESKVTGATFTNLVHSYDVEDGSSLILKLSHGAPVHAFFSWNSKTWIDRFEIVGSEGKIIAEPLDGGSLIVIRGRDREELDLPPPENAHLPCVDDFLTACRDGREPLCDGAAGRRTTLLLEEAIRASR
jgi:predicted dehydrogenase